jgi:hypothetical protein
MSRLSERELEHCVDVLLAYDVVDKGWEHERKAPKFNLTLVLKHLARDLVTEHFDMELAVRPRIAPDSIAYALRLMRWTRQPSINIRREEDSVVRTKLATTKLHPDNRALNAFAAGVGQLSMYLRDTDHPKDRKKAQLNRDKTIARAAGLLVISAEMQADVFGFDLVEAFDNRIDNLREHFGLPEPPTI